MLTYRLRKTGPCELEAFSPFTISPVIKPTWKCNKNIVNMVYYVYVEPDGRFVVDTIMGADCILIIGFVTTNEYGEIRSFSQHEA